MGKEDQITEFVELQQPLSSKQQSCPDDDHSVTMTGTIVRGYQSGQVVEVQLDLPDKEIQRLTSTEGKSPRSRSFCSRRQGIHIILMSFIFIPIAFCSSICVAFYVGTMTWYNIYVYFSEDKSIWYKISVCPVLILTFPFTVGFSSLGLGLYASVIQVSWFYDTWYKEFWDFEKGFYGWICKNCALPQCSPYEIVILDESQRIPEEGAV